MPSTMEHAVQELEATFEHMGELEVTLNGLGFYALARDVARADEILYAVQVELERHMGVRD